MPIRFHDDGFYFSAPGADSQTYDSHLICSTNGKRVTRLAQEALKSLAADGKSLTVSEVQQAVNTYVLGHGATQRVRWNSKSYPD
jgi:hypothetical protein